MTAKFVIVIPTFCGVCLYGCGRNATREEQIWTMRSEIGPVIVSPSCVDFENTFLVCNPSPSEAMRLCLHSKSCQCLSYQVDPACLQPGRCATVSVHAHVAPDTKLNELGLLFQTGLAQRPWLELQLHITAFAALELLPPKFPLITISGGQEHRIEFEVIAHQIATEDVQPIRVAPSSPALHVDVGHVRQCEKNGMRTSAVRCNLSIPCATPSESTAAGRVQITASHCKNVLVREIYWHRQWPITSFPAEVFLHADPETSTQKTVTLHGDRPFALTGIEQDEHYVRVQATIGVTSNDHLVQITCTPLHKTMKAANVLLTLHTDSVGQPEVRLPLHILWKNSASR